MKISILDLFAFTTSVAVAIGAELTLGLASTAIDSIGTPIWFTIIVFSAAAGLVFLLPPSTKNCKSIPWAVYFGLCISISLIISIVNRWESGGPFGGMANFIHLVCLLELAMIAWSSITIFVSCWPTSRYLAKYFLVLPLICGILLLGLHLLTY